MEDEISNVLFLQMLKQILLENLTENIRIQNIIIFIKASFN